MFRLAGRCLVSVAVLFAFASAACADSTKEPTNSSRLILSILANLDGTSSDAGVDLELRKLLLVEADFLSPITAGGVSAYDQEDPAYGRAAGMVQIFSDFESTGPRGVISIALEASQPPTSEEMQATCDTFAEDKKVVRDDITLTDFASLDTEPLGFEACGFSVTGSRSLDDSTIVMSGYLFVEDDNIGGVVAFSVDGAEPFSVEELVRLTRIVRDRFRES